MRWSTRAIEAALPGLRDMLADTGRLGEAAEVQRRLVGAAPDDPCWPTSWRRRRAPSSWLPRPHAVLPALGARAVAEAAVSASPSSPDALLALAEARGRRATPPAAREAVGTALDEDPALPSWRAGADRRGRRLAGTGDGGGATPGRAVATPASTTCVGCLLQATGREAEAVAALRRGARARRVGRGDAGMRELLREARRPRPRSSAARHDLLIGAAPQARAALPLRPLRGRGAAAGLALPPLRRVRQLRAAGLLARSGDARGLIPTWPRLASVTRGG